MTSATGEQTYSAFFYGTLMHPKVLTRVIKNDGSHLAIAPAVLNSYVRHRVKYASFPAIIPYELSERFLKVSLDQKDQCVRGVVVRGLTLADMNCINHFEGLYYKRITVNVQLLQEVTHLSAAMDSSFFTGDETPGDCEPDSSQVKCLAYIWDQAINDLSQEIWCYESFVQKSLHQYLQ